MYNLSANVLGFKTISIAYDDYELFNINDFRVKNGNKLFKIINSSFNGENSLLLFLDNFIDIKYPCYISYNNLKIKASYSKLFLTSEFNDKYYYDDNLGLSYNLNFSTFTLWSPAATSVSLLIYNNGDTSINETPKEYSMTEINGTWKITISLNLKNKFYTYKICVYDNISEVIDPYAKAVGINGLRGAIIDLKETNPVNWNKDNFQICNNYTDAILYETNIRDISANKTSAIHNKGKFLGLTEENTKSANNMTTGLSHIKELGITHVQLMPIFDFSYISVDEENPHNYNWGYDPQNYNVPEGSYSLNPYDPLCRISELKTMIQTFHQNNIAVNMDVVFNHMFYNHFPNFEKIFPGYYFRYDEFNNLSNGSGCSNDIASENKMVQKFILDSVIYWCTEYHIDGFRFDLMGLHDIDTMNTIFKNLKSLNKNSMIYGEGWDLDTILPKELRATQYNFTQLPNIGFFNDTIRDCIKGSTFSDNETGFISGKSNLETLLKFCITGCSLDIGNHKAIYSSPCQTINYVSCHDNHTLWDKLQLSNDNNSIDDKKNMIKLACGIILTSQGVPFLHSGIEFCRTKFGISNSFNSSDKINSIDYDRKYEFKDVFYYIKALINLRKNHPAFRMFSKDDIKNHLEFLSNTPKNLVAFILKNNANRDSFENLLVIYNANNFSTELTISNGKWYQIVDKNNAGKDILKTINSNIINVSPISLNIFFQ
ncbi:type I pullulanase [Clostridium botulinum]|uniref:Pullulanase n=1 Tax=Clostridium botulinum C/D str. DC5 TaxID=1443128 RepID=A0A0A0II13_CLOBO|nr:type I pullulanase [Clostridium botulinum]KGM99886.1 pullulanase [Clostridium botulinum C/D str. DC5]KOC55777.1 pullulanase [Clostridium botulinum]KOC57467.1 pullulanase [Clostridium botulinum]MCD3234754.1 type I pullulanase [Clostridium botulinum D/C]MCD3240623.1 type I pullulanase [Clostridium botulinum D/C]